MAWGGITAANAQQQKPREPFDIYIEYVDRICDYHKLFPSVDFVYGNPNKETPGFLVVVTPHPENAAATQVPFTSVSPSDFRVWIEAGQQELGKGWTGFGLFEQNNQCVKYLDVRRKNTSAFALYISSDDIKERVPHGDLHNITPILNFQLRFKFARRMTSQWPLEWAAPIAHPGMVNTYSLHFFPSEHFLTNKVEWADEGDVYMDKNPKKKYFYNRELVWQMPGWYFNLSYKQKNYIREKINDNHYIIFTLWKDEEHTQPLTFDYFKEQLWLGGFSDDPNMMVKDRNYIALPHKGFDDWTMFIPWTTIHYWWKDGIKATKDNHTCFGYYTLTLSNDGKTPATNHDFDYSGWLSIDVGYEETQKKPTPPGGTGERRDTCQHPWFKYHKDYRGIHSEPKPNGCTTDYKKYWVWKNCGVCDASFGYEEELDPIGTRCTNHDMKEVGRKEREKVTTIGGVNGNTIEVKTIIDVVYACQNECCDYKMTIPTSKTETTIVDPPLPPEGEEQKCPPHIWHYSSEKHKQTSSYPTTVIEELKMDVDTLRIKMGETEITLIKRDGLFFTDSLASRQLWLALNKDNNYLGISKTDRGKLNNVNYQEAYDLIEKISERANKEKGISMNFSLPTPDEMHQLLKDSIVKPVTQRAQNITTFFVDSIEVYDGKGRKLTKEQLSTAPEGAKVKVLVGKMGIDGKVEMVDISTIDKSTGFILKGEPNEPKAERKIVTTTKFYHTYKRQCVRCGLTENIRENVFRNMRYHRPLIND